jgi:hypothetical protein
VGVIRREKERLETRRIQHFSGACLLLREARGRKGRGLCV